MCYYRSQADGDLTGLDAARWGSFFFNVILSVMLHKPTVNLFFSIKIQITHNIIAFVSRQSIMTNDAKMNRMAKSLMHLSFTE